MRFHGNEINSILPDAAILLEVSIGRASIFIEYGKYFLSSFKSNKCDDWINWVEFWFDQRFVTWFRQFY